MAEIAGRRYGIVHDGSFAHLAAFITEMRTSHNLTAPWVALGGSYPGSLAAWYRLEFPELTAGCWSASGPVKAQATAGQG